MKFTAKRTDSDEWVTGYYVKESALNLNIIDIGGFADLARICHVIVVDGEFFHIKPETLKLIGEVKKDIKIYCATCDNLIQESIRESINVGSGLFETVLVYPHKCKAIFEFKKESINIVKDGDMWCARFGDFINLQESIAGFGGTYLEALSNLLLEKMKNEPTTM